MKSMENDDSVDVNNQNNWLGFSLSPQINNIGVPSHPHHSQPSSAASAAAAEVVPASFYHTVPLNNYGFYYGLEAENVGLYSALPIMPLKSDGSLYGMEALSRSQAQAMGTTSTPKLENFLGGEAMGTPHYECSVAETMPLSLDTVFYNQASRRDQNNQNYQNHIQHINTQQQQQQELHAQQHLSYYSTLRNHDVMLEGSKQSQTSDTNVQVPNLGEDGVPGLKNWVVRNLTNSHAQDSKMIVPVEENGGESGSIGSMPYGDLQSLSLSMSPSSQSSCVTSSQRASPAVIDSVAMDTKKRGPEKVDQKQIVHRKSIDTFGQRTSQYRGVTRHRWTGRYEAHLWDNSCKKEGQSRKGRQVYLGGYDMEEKAARAYDLAALKYWGPSTHINFPLENYTNELEEMKNMTRQEYVAHLRRKSSGFSRGASMYRGVTRHHQHGRWQARIGRVAGNKDLYLGTFSTQEEAAEAYDIAAIKFRGVNAVTNFDITKYDVEKIMASNNLLSSELARRNRETDGGTQYIDHNKPSAYEETQETILMQKSCESQSDQWKMVLYQSSQQLEHQNPPRIEMQKSCESQSDQWKMVLYQSSQQLEHQNPPRIEADRGNQSFPVALDNMFHHQEVVEESSKMRTHVSNPSSLATSLSSSREGSPDRTSLPMLSGMPSTASKLLATNLNSNVNSWDPSPHLRPALSLPHMPVFAAWTDA
ncbi:hypothetical protein VNO77_25132 [Canavalia gladiata]|uniref:AP2/ERF domain-containing protein n=1 Tax=Canavalia gladiata TaxID=3824 RepID=A0AAN9L8Y0_CANGL